MGLRVNGEAIALAEGAAQRADTSYSWEIEGRDTAELRLTELDQTDPAGRYRLRLTGDALRVERATLADWADSRVLLTFGDEGVDALKFSEDGLVEFLEQLSLELDIGSVPGLLLAEIVQRAVLV